MSHKTEDTLFLVGGALLGAAAMYLLDPDSGQRRRRRVADTASDAWESSRDYLSEGIDNVRDRASGVASQIGNRASDYADSSSWRNLGSRLFGHVRDWGNQAVDLAKDYTPDFGSYSKKARRTAKNMRRSLSGDTGFGTTSLVGTAATCCAIGAVTMYFFDPVKGRGRRAVCEDKIMSFVRRTGRSMNATGRHMANKLRGTAYEARRSVQGAAQTAQQLADRVRSELGRKM